MSVPLGSWLSMATARVKALLQWLRQRAWA